MHNVSTMVAIWTSGGLFDQFCIRCVSYDIVWKTVGAKTVGSVEMLSHNVVWCSHNTTHVQGLDDSDRQASTTVYLILSVTCYKLHEINPISVSVQRVAWEFSYPTMPW